MKTEDAALTETEFHRKMAARLFNETWTLLDKPGRTVEEDARMSHLAHASRLHWEYIGTAENLAIGEWQVSRVHAVLRQADAALFHAQRVLGLATQHGLGAFHVGYGHEAVARALALTQPQVAQEHLALARQAAAGIADAEDLKLLEADLATIVTEAAPKP